jgi:choline kinase
MHAIILAAGRGSRLAEHNPIGQPKCLMEIGGRSLLSRHLDLLQQLRIRRVDLVVGYEADQIIEHVAHSISRPEVAFHFNPRYQQGSVISLWAAHESLLLGSDTLLMDADVLYHPEILKRLVDSKRPNCFLLDQDFVPGDEPVKIAVRDGLMVEFRKRLEADLDYQFLGESVGFFRFSAAMSAKLAEECARFDAEGLADAPHEEALRNLLMLEPAAFGFEDVSGLPWIEIDFPEDVTRASSQILPAIRQDYPDF